MAIPGLEVQELDPRLRGVYDGLDPRVRTASPPPQLRPSAIPGLDIAESQGRFGPQPIRSAEGIAAKESLRMPPNSGPPRPTSIRPVAPPVTPTPMTATPSPSATARTMERLGRGAGKATRFFGPAGVGLAALSSANDYKIDDPEVDSSAGGTFRALRNGDFAGAGRSISKGALETLMDAGSAVAGAADYVIPGKAPASTAYHNFLRDQFGDQLVDNTGGAPQPAATPTSPGLPNALNQPAGPTGVLPRPSAASDYGMGAQPGAAPGQSNVLRTDSTNMGQVVPGYGAEARAIDARTRQINDEMAATQRYLDKFGPGPNGGGVGGFGGATQSSELRRQFDETPSASVLSRNGISGYQSAQLQLQREQLAEARADRGERRALTAAGQNNTLAIAQMQDATQRRSNDQNNSTTLRGQELTYGAHLLPIQQAEQQRLRLAGLMQASGGDLNKARELAGKIGDATSLKQLTEQVQTNQSVSQAQDAQAQTRSKTALDIFTPSFTTTKTDAQGNTTTSFDEVGAKKALAVARGIYGEQFERMTPEQQRAIAPQIIAKVQNQTAETQVAPGWLDRAKRVVGMYEEPPTVTAPRDLRGGKVSRAGVFDSVPTNNWMVTLPNGQVIDYRNATADQLKELEPRLRP